MEPEAPRKNLVKENESQSPRKTSFKTILKVKRKDKDKDKDKERLEDKFKKLTNKEENTLLHKKVSQEQLLNLEKRYGIIPAKRDSKRLINTQLKHKEKIDEDIETDNTNNLRSSDLNHSATIQFAGEEIIGYETNKLTIGKKTPTFFSP